MIYFDYNGQSCKTILDVELLTVRFGSVDAKSGLERDVSRASFSTYNDMPLHLNTKYSDVYKEDFSIIKSNGDIFTDDEIRKVNKWLSSPLRPKWFTGHSYYTTETINYQGLFDITSYEYDMKGVIGINVTFTANSPYSWSDEIVKTFYVNGSLDATIICDNDEANGYVYPVITITPTSGHTVEEAKNLHVTIENISDTNPTTSKVDYHVYEGLPLTIDCKRLTVTDLADNVISSEDLGWSDVGYIYWLRFLDGENNIKITGDTKVEFRYREPRKKVGVWI